MPKPRPEDLPDWVQPYLKPPVAPPRDDPREPERLGPVVEAWKRQLTFTGSRFRVDEGREKRKRPPPWVKEMKFIAGTSQYAQEVFKSLSKTKEAITELDDYADAFISGIKAVTWGDKAWSKNQRRVFGPGDPRVLLNEWELLWHYEKVGRTYRNRDGSREFREVYKLVNNKRVRFWQKWEFVRANWNHVSREVVAPLLLNELQDRLVGAAIRASDRASRARGASSNIAGRVCLR